MKLFMPIRIKRRDNKHREAQVAGSEGILAVVLAIATADYTDWEALFHNLCGSI